MVQLKRYERQKAIDYARAWALGRNPVYHDYEKYGGDCTNYISQCLHAGNIPFDESGIIFLSVCMQEISHLMNQGEM